MRRRLREIEYDRVDEIKKVMKFTREEIASLLNVSPTQLSNYKKSTKVPADRYYGMFNALALAIEDEAREKRNRLNKLFGLNTTNHTS